MEEAPVFHFHGLDEFVNTIDKITVCKKDRSLEQLYKMNGLGNDP